MDEGQQLRHIDAELNGLRAATLRMGGLVEEQVADAMESLLEGKEELAGTVIARDDLIDAMEVETDTLATRIMVRRQPMASDLRLVISVMKITTHLERIGDEAQKIARMAKLALEESHLSRPHFWEVHGMGGQAQSMLHDVLDAFARMDAGIAGDLGRKDKLLDESFRSTMRSLITFVMEDPRTITHVFEVLWVVKALERIGDHAKNIAEYVIYAVKGEDVRHLSLENKERIAHD